MDDILIAGPSVEENIQTLKEVLTTLKKYKLELNWAKCLFVKREIEYLDYLVSDEGITINTRHIRAILDFPLPKNLRELLFGANKLFSSIYRELCLIEKARPLHEVTRKNVEFEFNKECIESFNLLKKELTSFPTVSL